MTRPADETRRAHGLSGLFRRSGSGESRSRRRALGLEHLYPEAPARPAPRRRRLRLLGGVLLVELLVVALVGGAWWATGDDLTWSVEVDSADEVLDYDADRIVLQTFDDELVILDRADGDRLGTFEHDGDRTVDEVSLVPGGLLVGLVERGRRDVLVRTDDRGEELWARSGTGRMIGVRAGDGVVAVAGRRGRPLGLDLEDGAVRWRGEGAVPPMYAEGPQLRETAVALVDATPGDGSSRVVDLATGERLGTMAVDVAGQDGVEVEYWRDVVVVAPDDGGLLRSVAGEPADVEPAVAATERLSLDHGSAGAVVLVGAGRRLGLDAETGVLTELPDLELDLDLDHGRTTGALDGDRLVVLDAGDGRSVTRDSADYLTVWNSGPDTAAVVEDPSVVLGWRHGIASDAGRLTLLGVDGETHGAWYVETTDLSTSTVLDQHEMVVVTDGPSGHDEVTLLGR